MVPFIKSNFTDFATSLELRKKEMRCALCLLLLIASVCLAKNSVTLTNCNDGNCASGCRKQVFDTDQCLQETAKNDSLKLSCYTGPSMCAETRMYSDSSCKNLRSTLYTVCQSCQGNYTLSCGALRNALWWIANCTDRACDECGGATIVPFNNCTNVNPGQWVIATRVFACTAVNIKTYPTSMKCTGSNYDFQYPGGYCHGGTILQCGKNGTMV